jgi:copper transport protein
LKPGIYNVLWANVSAVDGHALRASYPFTVLNADGTLPAETNTVTGVGASPDPPPQADGVAVRALSLLGLALIGAGAILILLLPAELGRARRGLVATVVAGLVILALATALNFVLIRDTYPGRDVAEIVRDTRIGSYWLVRIGSLPVMAVGAWMLLDSRKTAGAAVGGGLVAYLWAYSATSHAAAGAGSAWAIAFDILHGVSAVAWIGAVAGIAITVRLAGRDDRYRNLMQRFGLFASAMVFALLGTGFLSSLVELDSFDRLWTTRFGWTLTVKLLLTVPLLGVAFYNSRGGRRSLERQGAGEPRRFVRLALAEVLLGALVFAAAATLTQTTVAKSVFDRPPTRPFDQTSQAGDLSVRLQVDPNRTGLNTYTVTLNKDGKSVSADRVRLTFRYQDDQAVGASNLNLAASNAGTYIGQGPYLTLEGQWRIEVGVRRPDVDDVTGFFNVRPAGTAIGTVRTGGDWSNPAAGMSWNKLAGFMAVIAGIGLVASKGRVYRKPPRSFVWSTNVATLTAFGFAGLLLFGVHTHTGSGDLAANPIYPDANSINTGRTIFQQNCAACHGVNGVPPGNLNLSPYPLDLTVHAPLHPDGQLFQFISNGIPGSAMRSWSTGDGKLTDDQIWHVVNFLRTLQGSPR